MAAGLAEEGSAVLGASSLVALGRAIAATLPVEWVAEAKGLAAAYSAVPAVIITLRYRIKLMQLCMVVSASTDMRLSIKAGETSQGVQSHLYLQDVCRRQLSGVVSARMAHVQSPRTNPRTCTDKCS